MAQSQLAAQARRRHTFLLTTVSDVLPLESLLVLLSSLSINGNSTPYIRSFKSGSVSGFLVLSHTFQNVQSCISNRSVPQITVSVVRQMAHNMHIAYIASCIHIKLKIATKLYHCWLYAVPRTCNPNIWWVRDTTLINSRTFSLKEDGNFVVNKSPTNVTMGVPSAQLAMWKIKPWKMY